MYRYLLNKPYSPNIIKADENSLDKRIVLLRDTMTPGNLNFKRGYLTYDKKSLRGFQRT